MPGKKRDTLPPTKQSSKTEAVGDSEAELRAYQEGYDEAAENFEDTVLELRDQLAAMNDLVSSCSACNKPFTPLTRIRWHSGGFFCSEFCRRISS